MKTLRLTYCLIIFCIINTFAQPPKLDSLLNLEKSLPEGRAKVTALVEIGFMYSTKDSEKALIYYNKGKYIGEKLALHKLTGVVYSQMAMLYNNTGEFALSDTYLEKTKALTSKNDTVWMSFYQAGGLILKKRKMFSEAIPFMTNGVVYNQKYGKRKDIAGAYLNLANLQVELKQFRPAVANYYKALKIFDEIKENRGVAFCHQNLGQLLYELGQYNESLKNTQKSLVLKEKLNDKKSIASSNKLIGMNYMQLKQPQKANSYLEKSVSQNTDLDLPFELLDLYHLKARNYLLLKDSTSSKAFYANAIAKAQELNLQDRILEIQKEQENAMKAPPTKEVKLVRKLQTKQKLEEAKKRKDTALIMDNLSDLAKDAYDNQEYKKAYDYNEEYQSLRNEVYAPSILKQMKQIESEYNLEKRENDIKLLKKDQQLKNAKLKQQKIALFSSIGLAILILITAFLLFNRSKIIQKNKRKQDLNKIRNRIARDLHDDIGSTLSSIQIMSGLIEKQTSEDPKLNEAASRISHLSDKVATGMREIVWATNPENDKLESIISLMRKIAAEILQTSEISFSFNEKIKNKNVLIDPIVRKNILMIFKEAINNSRKYSQTEVIDIYISQGKQNLKLQVKDFGKGFNIEDTERGNGLDNMQKRADEIKAKLMLNSKPKQGTSVILIVPISHE